MEMMRADRGLGHTGEVRPVDDHQGLVQSDEAPVPLDELLGHEADTWGPPELPAASVLWPYLDRSPLDRATPTSHTRTTRGDGDGQ